MQYLVKCLNFQAVGHFTDIIKSCHMNLLVNSECVSLRTISKLGVKGGTTILISSLLHSLPPQEHSSQLTPAVKLPNTHMWVHSHCLLSISFRKLHSPFRKKIPIPGVLFPAILNNINTLITNTTYSFSSAYTSVTSFEHLSILK